MDPETLKLVQQAIREGITSASWLILILALVASGMGAFLGAYLKKKGEDVALQENFEQVLRQLRAQTEATEAIKHGFEVRLKNLESLQAQHAFVRELYVSGLREYSSAQAHGLRDAYLLLFEPLSSAVNCDGKNFEERLSMAIQAVMQPLRSYIGLLDETTMRHVYDVHHELLELHGKTQEDVKKRKVAIFDATEKARQSIKADQIAFRLGLIDHPLQTGKEKQ